MRLGELSIRLRLTLWYVAVLLVILAAVSTGVYVFVRRNLESTVRAKLEEGYGTVEAVIKNSGGDIMDV